MPTMTKISSTAVLAQKEISSVKNFDFLAVLNAEKEHITQLIPKNLIFASSMARIRRLPIYLESIAIRIRKLQEPGSRDSQLWFEVAEAIRLFAAKAGSMPLQPGSEDEVVQARWLIEEFRVSQFAQSMGTSEPVSLKRIQKLLG
jgi:ATP-dependent helicase HrpA